jgi:hypothetical protein
LSTDRKRRTDARNALDDLAAAGGNCLGRRDGGVVVEWPGSVGQVGDDFQVVPVATDYLGREILERLERAPRTPRSDGRLNAAQPIDPIALSRGRPVRMRPPAQPVTHNQSDREITSVSDEAAEIVMIEEDLVPETWRYR